jgi:GMP synthase-like glutamine amidotransferase
MADIHCELIGHNSFDDEIWIVKLVDFVKEVLAQDRVRLIGVCFGHQIIGRALEQKVGRSDRGWEVSVTPMQLSAKGKELFGVEELVSQNIEHEHTHTCRASGWALH